MNSYTDMELIALARRKFTEDSYPEKLRQRLTEHLYRADYEVIIDEFLMRKTSVIDTCKLCDRETRNLTECFNRKTIKEMLIISFNSSIRKILLRYSPICKNCIARVLVDPDPLNVVRIIKRISAKRESFSS